MIWNVVFQLDLWVLFLIRRNVYNNKYTSQRPAMSDYIKQIVFFNFLTGVSSDFIVLPVTNVACQQWQHFNV